MGAGSGVPIEPAEQTKLIDSCVAQAGVIGGGVPGGMSSSLSVALVYFLPTMADRLSTVPQLEVTTRSGFSSATQLPASRIRAQRKRLNTSGPSTRSSAFHHYLRRKVWQKAQGSKRSTPSWGSKPLWRSRRVLPRLYQVGDGVECLLCFYAAIVICLFGTRCRNTRGRHTDITWIY